MYKVNSIVCNSYSLGIDYGSHFKQCRSIRYTEAQTSRHGGCFHYRRFKRLLFLLLLLLLLLFLLVLLFVVVLLFLFLLTSIFSPIPQERGWKQEEVYIGVAISNVIICLRPCSSKLSDRNIRKNGHHRTYLLVLRQTDVLCRHWFSIFKVLKDEWICHHGDLFLRYMTWLLREKIQVL